MLQNRLNKARSHAEKHDVDAIVFFNMSNVRYLSGFTGSDGAVVLGRDASWFLTDSRYTTQASRQVVGLPTVEYRIKLDGITELVREQGFRRIGFESEHTTFAVYESLRQKLPETELVPIGEELAQLRLIKDPSECELLSRVARLASEALLSILPLVKPGAVERELALELEFAMRRAGAENSSFDFIVASGERGSLPHGRAGDKALAAGELVTIDFGARYEGYCSDETVTVAVGVPDERKRRIYGIVKEAHDRAIAAVRPGAELREIDRIARGYIEEQGYGAFFGHGLGHGVGLDVHEKPVVSPRGEGMAAVGMVFTIEPGIYIPGWGGVRIEDTVIVTEDGCRPITMVPKELMIL